MPAGDLLARKWGEVRYTDDGLEITRYYTHAEARRTTGGAENCLTRRRGER